jgi:hypothetical protein
MGRKRRDHVDTVDELIKSQLRDDATRNVRKRHCEVRESDLGRNGGDVLANAMGREPDPSEVVAEYLDAEELGWTELPPRVLVGLTPIWDGKMTSYVPGKGPCPGCNDSELRPDELCLVCSASKLMPRQRRMMPAKEKKVIMNPPLKGRMSARRAKTAEA